MTHAPETSAETVRICACRTRNHGQARFCRECGRPLSNEQPTIPPAPDNESEPIAQSEVHGTPLPLPGIADVTCLFLQTVRLLQRQHPRVQRVTFLVAVAGFGLLLSLPLLGFAFRQADTPRLHAPAAGPMLFQDVPLDHPLYRAWKTLLKTGAPLSDRNESSRPYDPLTWEDWNRVVGHAFQQLVPELEVQQLLAFHRSGPMHPQDLRSELMELGRLLEVGKADAYLPAGSVEIPSRLEAFAALSRLLSEAGR